MASRGTGRWASSPSWKAGILPAEIGIHQYNPIIATSKPDTRMVIYTAVEVRFGAGEGKSYRIESSFDNTHWTPVESGISGTGGDVTRFYTIQAMPKRFSRAVEE